MIPNAVSVTRMSDAGEDHQAVKQCSNIQWIPTAVIEALV